MLKVEGLSAYYGDYRAITEVSLHVEDGEFVAVMGPNGHGKSTLLKAICGLLKHSSGSVTLGDECIDDWPTHKIVENGLVYVAESRDLFPDMTVMENLLMGAWNRNARAKESENLDYVFSLFPRLGERRKQRASTLSGGEGRMLAIGRGLMSNARCLVIDEPSVGLAPKTRYDVFERIRGINDSGITVLLVEQTLAEEIAMVRRFYLMEDGRIVHEGAADEIGSSAEIKNIFLGLG